jgi:ADP-ribosyl-[dinitrogen reductase] hydrolase
VTSSLDRAVGALVGLGVGDAVGTTLEFQAPGSFEPITDMVGGGPFDLEPGQWTDDTSMALCLAESLVDTGGMDLADQLRRYVLWRDEGYLSVKDRCFDIGHTTTTQLTRFLRSGDPVDPDPDQEQAANGSLMRLAPAAIRWWPEIDVAQERAAESSRTTHAADRPVDCCRLLGAMLAALIGGRPADEVLGADFWRWGPLHPEVEAVARGSWRTKEPPAIKGGGYCVEALEAAIWAVAGADDLKAAVLRAANLGDDADTTAAIAGQLAGARGGAAGIPRGWREKLELSDRMAALAASLWRAGGGPAADADEAASPAWAHDRFHHAWWVEPASVLAGEYPASEDDPARTRQKVNLLVDAGVRTFVDLTTPSDPLDPYAHEVEAAARARRLDLRHVQAPIPDMGVLDDDGYDGVLAVIHEAQRRGAVYVHCWGGRGRTGTVVGCFLAAQGLTFEEIEARLVTLRAGSKKAHVSVPESAAQVEVIRRRAGR